TLACPASFAVFAISLSCPSLSALLEFKLNSELAKASLLTPFEFKASFEFKLAGVLEFKAEFEFKRLTSF
ncbi:hypothetical protein, partial [Campylobacter troglodytis]|uniref:hypothetical protein n=1 Tax=Campylobacter troglodytis TaxID=654363 RepID=UPI00163BD8AF